MRPRQTEGIVIQSQSVVPPDCIGAAQQQTVRGKNGQVILYITVGDCLGGEGGDACAGIHMPFSPMPQTAQLDKSDLGVIGIPLPQGGDQRPMRLTEKLVFIVGAEPLPVVPIVPGPRTVHGIVQPLGDIHVPLLRGSIGHQAQDQPHPVGPPLGKVAALFQGGKVVFSLSGFQLIPVHRHIGKGHIGILSVVLPPGGQSLHGIGHRLVRGGNFFRCQWDAQPQQGGGRQEQPQQKQRNPSAGLHHASRLPRYSTSVTSCTPSMFCTGWVMFRLSVFR